MGSYAGLYVKDKAVFFFKNESYGHFVDYFQSDELMHLKGAEAIPYASNWMVEDLTEDDYPNVEVYAYRTTVSVLKDRMDLFGITSDLASRVFEEIRSEKISDNAEYAEDSSFKSARGKFLEENKYLESMTYESWGAQLHEWLKQKKAFRNYDTSTYSMDDPFALFHYHDDSILLRLILDQLPPEDVIVFDLSDVYEGGWVTEKNPEILSAQEEAYTKSAAPPIIITEGVFDASAIADALTIVKPHLRDYVTFLDFGQKNDGGASAAVRLLKSLAAAGVENRVLALFDNDTAAQEELAGLDKNKLPAHFDVMLYPDLPLAKNYPTLGPQGSVEMDVNGLACSIEMYLGRDALEDASGKLMPVQWKSKLPKTGKYQGEVDHKSDIQKKYIKKVKDAKKNGVQEGQDWTGMELLLDALLDKLSKLPFVKTW